MWSHYAENHKGICLKFKSTISDLPTMTQKVQYKAIHEKIRYFNDDDSYSIYHLIFTKSENWSYEKEIRAFIMIYNGNVEFDIENLTEIIFGCKTDESTIIEIRELVKNLGYKHISFKKVVQSKSSYKIKITKI
ncbi:MAG TPA: DUF2971 domain-containing protein [Flavobacterium sp.]|nr:DUF2971 domain-containing protein [Flavobacterium sp.]